MPKLMERVAESVRKDMRGVSKMDATCAAGVILATPGIVWIIVAHWGDLMAYVAGL